MADKKQYVTEFTWITLVALGHINVEDDAPIRANINAAIAANAPSCGQLFRFGNVRTIDYEGKVNNPVGRVRHWEFQVICTPTSAVESTADLDHDVLQTWADAIVAAIPEIEKGGAGDWYVSGLTQNGSGSGHISTADNANPRVWSALNDGDLVAQITELKELAGSMYVGSPSFDQVDVGGGVKHGRLSVTALDGGKGQGVYQRVKASDFADSLYTNLGSNTASSAELLLSYKPNTGMETGGLNVVYGIKGKFEVWHDIKNAKITIYDLVENTVAQVANASFDASVNNTYHAKITMINSLSFNPSVVGNFNTPQWNGVASQLAKNDTDKLLAMFPPRPLEKLDFLPRSILANDMPIGSHADFFVSVFNIETASASGNVDILEFSAFNSDRRNRHFRQLQQNGFVFATFV